MHYLLVSDYLKLLDFKYDQNQCSVYIVGDKINCEKSVKLITSYTFESKFRFYLKNCKCRANNAMHKKV